jgi:hypothetical protein
MDVLGDAIVVVGGLLLVGQLVDGRQEGDGVPGREQRQQVRWKELRHRAEPPSQAVDCKGWQHVIKYPDE